MYALLNHNAVIIKLDDEVWYFFFTSICRRVFATSNGQVAAAATAPATKPAVKLAPIILPAVGFSPMYERMLLRV